MRIEIVILALFGALLMSGCTDKSIIIKASPVMNEIPREAAIKYLVSLQSTFPADEKFPCHYGQDSVSGLNGSSVYANYEIKSANMIHWLDMGSAYLSINGIDKGTRMCTVYLEVYDPKIDASREAFDLRTTQKMKKAIQALSSLGVNVSDYIEK